MCYTSFWLYNIITINFQQYSIINVMSLDCNMQSVSFVPSKDSWMEIRLYLNGQQWSKLHPHTIRPHYIINIRLKTARFHACFYCTCINWYPESFSIIRLFILDIYVNRSHLQCTRIWNTISIIILFSFCFNLFLCKQDEDYLRSISAAQNSYILPC